MKANAPHEVKAEPGHHVTLVAQLLEAAKCPPGGSLPPGTAKAAWQLSGLCLESMSIRNMEERRACLEQLMSSVKPLLEAETSWRDPTSVGEYYGDPAEARALKFIPMAICMACDAAHMQYDINLVWTSGQSQVTSPKFMREYVASTQLREAVQLLGDPRTSPRDRAAVSTQLAHGPS